MATPRLQSESEAELLARVRSGEHEAFYELVRPYERAIYLTAFSIINNDADAEEVVQEAILKAFKAIGSFRAEAKFSTWLIQITMNEARMKRRKDRRHLFESLDQPKKGEDDGDYIPHDFADWREIPSEALENARLREGLKKGLASLSAKYRQVLILRDIEHLNIAETAKLIGISESAVKTRLLRARLMMRDALAPGFDGAWKKGRQYEKVRPW
jgi:RNA polymerase sigma-70 factor (ECF subfamily)